MRATYAIVCEERFGFQVAEVGANRHELPLDSKPKINSFIRVVILDISFIIGMNEGVNI